MTTTTFDLVVPKNTNHPISQVIAILSLTNENPATFTIVDPEGSSHSFPALAPPTPPATAASTFFDYPAPLSIPRNDRVTIDRQPAPANDPMRRTCRITFNLKTDFNPAQNCDSTMPVPSETWHIVVTGTEISGICQISFSTRDAVLSNCFGAGANLIIQSTNPAELATVNGQANQACGLDRPGVDVVFVLDRSGSMGTNTNFGNATITRIQALRDAVKTFVDTWTALLDPDDRLSVVTFDHLIETLPGIATGLQTFDAALAGIVKTNIDTLGPRGATSIGGGLLTAAQQISTVLGRRRVILLVTDGEQNTEPLVAFDPINKGVFTSVGGVTNLLPGLDNNPYQIHVVTIGPIAGSGETLNANIAFQTGGLFINTEDDGGQLSTFFLELLGNFLRFNSWETARLMRGEVTTGKPNTTPIPISTTTQRVVFNVSWPAGMHATLRLSVKAPRALPGAQPKVFTKEGDSGSLQIVFDPTGMLDPIKDWVATVEQVGGQSGQAIPFNLVVLVDDLAVKSDLSIVPADYQPGDRIHLRARLSSFGEPVQKLKGDDGKVVAHLVRPGQSIGELLARVKDAKDPHPQDPTTPVGARLDKLMKENPKARGRNHASPDLVVLKEKHPGIYEGSFPADLIGHYNVLFEVQGPSGNAGSFTRQGNRSIFVRAVPESKHTESDISVTVSKPDSKLVVTFTPRTRTGEPLGPGWRNHFWLTAQGLTPVKASDNGDKTYTIQLPFSGKVPKQVSLHFLDVLQRLDDTVTADTLPRPLDDDTVLIRHLKVH